MKNVSELSVKNNRIGYIVIIIMTIRMDGGRFLPLCTNTNTRYRFTVDKKSFVVNQILLRPITAIKYNLMELNTEFNVL